MAAVGAVVVGLLAGCTPPGLPAPIDPGSATGTVGSTVRSGPTTTAGPAAAAMVVGVDGTPTGFNPYEIADYSPAARAVAGLVLPMVSSTGPDGVTSFNPELIPTAAVTSDDPFTVTYQLHRSAAWSDGTPITAEDFAYLADQLKTAPGTVDPAGYRAITGVGSKDAGKTVVITFSQRIADWRQLFPYLLPAHILKDLPGGFTAGFAAGLPVSGNRYKMEGFDTTTGEITLVRNDKYWGGQPGLATLVLRIGQPSELLEALGRGDLQAAWLRPDAKAAAALDRQVQGADRVRLPLPGTFQLIANAAAGPLAEPGVRRGVFAGLDHGAVADRLAGGWDAGILTGEPFGAGGDSWPAADPQALARQLAAAGYGRVGAYYDRAGQVLRLTLGYPAGSTEIAAAATQVQRQLGELGVEIDLVRLDSRTLTARVAAGQVDLALLFVPRGPSDALAAAAAYTCPPAPTADVPDPLRTGNLSGYCDAGTDTGLAAALSGGSLRDVLAGVAPAAPATGLGQPLSVWVTTPAWTKAVGAGVPLGMFTSPLDELGVNPPR